ncbi:MAG: alpha/beta fold hydrolase [Kofleriaceae bacterium]
MRTGRDAIDELRAPTVDGITLRIDRLRGAGTGKGVVVCLHAMMTDGRYFGARREHSFAAALVDAGYDVLVADFRGHGRSTPPRAGEDDWSFDDLVELDLPAIISCATEISGCSPGALTLIGHSRGGLVATAARATGRIDPPRLVVLPATAVWLVGPGGDLRRRAVMAAYRGLTALFGKAPIRALRVGTADEAPTYVRQLTGWARSARWTSLRGIDYRAQLATITTPVWPLVGAGDWMCTVDDARGFAADIPTATPVRVVGTRFGDALDPDHFQLFTWPALRPVWDELIAKLG